MTSMQGNPHYREAVSIPEGISLWDAPDVPAIMSEAAVEATLALAFEQRTANLIAAYNAEVTVHGRIKGDGIAIDRHNEILDRLGL